ncbi:MAG: hypothetical protein ACI9ZH_002522 [Paracoccaceae bacterium]|jgi:hypothetical protein
MIWWAMAEAAPGPRWAGLFAEHWPAYRRWWLGEGDAARPTYMACRRALATHMPELVPLYDQLCELAGGGGGGGRSGGAVPQLLPTPALSGGVQSGDLDRA